METVKAATIVVQDTNISVSSSYYYSKKSWATVSEKLCEEFSCPDQVSLHLESEMLEVIGSNIKSNRCCVVLQGYN